MTPTLLAGRYDLLEPIGSGGAAEVWKARDTELDVIRAVKILSERAASRSTLRRRLRAEAQVLAQLDHPHVLRVLDIGMHDGRPFIVMELLEGGSVADRVRQQGPLPPDRAITVMLEVLSALAVAHGQGIVHRDIKPQNILLDAQGRAVVADFGIALIEAGDRRTRTGVAMGSFAFMPPEQRVDAKRVGATADLYAAGCSLFWMLTGRNPVDLFAEPVDGTRWEGLPPAIVEVLQWATQAEPQDRPASAAALARRLQLLAPAEVRLREDLDPLAFPEPRSAQTLRPGSPDQSTADIDHAATTVDLHATPPVAPVASSPQAPDTTGSDGRRAWVLPVAASVVLLLVLGLVGWRFLPGAASEPATESSPLTRALHAEPGLPDAPDSADAGAAGGAGVQDGTPDADASTGDTPDGADGHTDATGVAAPDLLARELPRQWAGSFGGNGMELTLYGPDDDLTGTVTIRFDGNAVHTPVRGTWDPDQAELHLRDAIDESDAGRYEASLVEGRLSGTFRSRNRADGSGKPMIRSFTLRAVRR